ncbi:MAG: hypothetical protein DDT29_02429 [Dehalococcoidia bacterium]|nr:hypothetical protein [Bacillota bacterium]
MDNVLQKAYCDRKSKQPLRRGLWIRKTFHPRVTKDEIPVYSGTNCDVSNGRGPDTGKTRTKYEEQGIGGLA